MSEYKPGTVAIATVRNQMAIRVMRDPDDDGWIEATGQWTADGRVTDVQPLVCLLMTRDDADVFEQMQNFAGQHGYMRSPRVQRFIAAIREQLPEPEPPKRWTVATYASPGCGFTSYLHDNGVQCGAIYNCDAERAQTIADALNAAEATS